MAVPFSAVMSWRSAETRRLALSSTSAALAFVGRIAAKLLRRKWRERYLREYYAANWRAASRNVEGGISRAIGGIIVSPGNSKNACVT